MGLYRIPIWPEKNESIPHLMQEMGFPVVKTQALEDGVHYFCTHPKRSNKFWSFEITREKQEGPCFFTCGLCQLSKQIVSRLELEGVFYKEYAEKKVSRVRTRRLGGKRRVVGSTPVGM
jgi:hypothetical protein